MLKSPKKRAKLLQFSLLGLFAAVSNSKQLPKPRNSVLRYVLGNTQPAVESVVECEQQSLASVSLNVVKHLGDWTTLGEPTQTGRNVGGKREMVNVRNRRNRVTDDSHSVTCVVG